ncbi:MAG: RNA 2',3'-cyclic phosphodiesterase [Candidatus Korarchaeum sp.]|nr:RNA 2',3'-cyclic phosphodiesterase [Candidatus Korarchaeum sp.]MDW8035486.1 RNA 2',3'-cyclic phosphodiesterase [Candidatus Korarchaeum sp.]
MAIRSFIAMDVNNPDVISKILSIQEELLSSNAKLKPVERENLHFTLKFLGDVEESRLEMIKKVMDDILRDFKPFEMELISVGAFPTMSRPNVIWIGTGEGRDLFIRIAGELDRALSRLGFQRERRGVEPHLTIARVKGPIGNLPEVVRRLSSVRIGYINVKEIKLKKSILTPKGPIYGDLHVVGLSD